MDKMAKSFLKIPMATANISLARIAPMSSTRIPTSSPYACSWTRRNWRPTKLLVTTQIALDETAAASYETALGLENVSALSFVYTLDPETLEISQCTASVVADGTQVTMSSVFFTYSADALTPPEFVNSLANPESSRTVTLVYNDVSTEYTIAAEALLRYTVPEGYEAYADANRTPLPDATENAGANETIYLLPIEMADAESASAE